MPDFEQTSFLIPHSFPDSFQGRSQLKINLYTKLMVYIFKDISLIRILPLPKNPNEDESTVKASVT